MKTVLIIFGTRPEAIKLAPVIKQLKKQRSVKTIVCSTGQHKEMLDQVLCLFKIKADINLGLMHSNQNLYDITTGSLKKLDSVFNKIKPDLLIVQGDTTTAFTAALAAYYKKIKIAHIEAGLRTNNIFSPYPEEVNRRFISVLTDINFAPTEHAAQNLVREGIPQKNVYITGNTVIDAVLEIKSILDKKKNSIALRNKLVRKYGVNLSEKEFVLVTLHRREKFGERLQHVLKVIDKLSQNYSHLNFIYPVHLNPNVRKSAKSILKNRANIFLIPPLDYLEFNFLMKNCRFIISDSGGVQEECFVYKKPVIVLRDLTERSEAVDAGYAFVTG